MAQVKQSYIFKYHEKSDCELRDSWIFGDGGYNQNGRWINPTRIGVVIEGHEIINLINNVMNSNYNRPIFIAKRSGFLPEYEEWGNNPLKTITCNWKIDRNSFVKITKAIILAFIGGNNLIISDNIFSKVGSIEFRRKIFGKCTTYEIRFWTHHSLESGIGIQKTKIIIENSLRNAKCMDLLKKEYDINEKVFS